MVVENIRRVQAMRDRITVIPGDAFDVMPWFAGGRDVGCFVDPPYSADSASKGRTLYLYHKLNHQKLFSVLANWRGSWVLTEDNTRTIRRLALCYRFASERVPMNASDNTRKHELVIWRFRG
jgi:site-specific DNA-adenine methylase